MTPPLRRAHRNLWLLLAIALPVGFIAALRANQPPLEQEPIAQRPPAPLPILVSSAQTDSLVVNLRRAAQGFGKQVEIVVKQPFGVPSAVVRVGQNGTWRAVGLLNAPGIYRFSLPAIGNHPQVEIVDDVHRRIIQTIQL